MADNQRTVNRQSEKQTEGVLGWVGARAVCMGGWQAVPTAADIKLRKEWTTVPLDRRSVYNLDKRMQPIKLRWLVVR